MPAGGADPAPTSCLAVRLAFTSPASPESLGPGAALSHPAQAGSRHASFCLRPARGAAGGFLGTHCPAAPRVSVPPKPASLWAGPPARAQGPVPRPHSEPSVEEAPRNSPGGGLSGQTPPSWRSLGPLRGEPCIWARPLGRVPPLPPGHHGL